MVPIVKGFLICTDLSIRLRNTRACVSDFHKRFPILRVLPSSSYNGRGTSLVTSWMSGGTMKDMRGRGVSITALVICRLVLLNIGFVIFLVSICCFVGGYTMIRCSLVEWGRCWINRLAWYIWSLSVSGRLTWKRKWCCMGVINTKQSTFYKDTTFKMYQEAVFCYSFSWEGKLERKTSVSRQSNLQMLNTCVHVVIILLWSHHSNITARTLN